MTRLRADLLRNSRAPMSEQDHCLARLKSAFCFSSQGQAQLVNQPGPFCIHRELLFQEMALTWIPERVIFQSGIGMEWTVCFQEQLYGCCRRDRCLAHTTFAGEEKKSGRMTKPFHESLLHS